MCMCMVCVCVCVHISVLNRGGSSWLQEEARRNNRCVLRCLEIGGGGGKESRAASGGSGGLEV